jgi:hypothetical protein
LKDWKYYGGGGIVSVRPRLLNLASAGAVKQAVKDVSRDSEANFVREKRATVASNKNLI